MATFGFGDDGGGEDGECAVRVFSFVAGYFQ